MNDQRAVAVLDAWRRQMPLEHQYVVGSRFAKVSVTIQRQGCTLSVWFGDSEEEARIAAATELVRSYPDLAPAAAAGAES